MISVRDVSKRFRDQQALKAVSAEFESGKITGVIGRNGSGKTVLLKCVIGLMKPDHGEIIVNGLRVGKDVDFVEDVGFIINRPGFLDDMSGYRNLRYLAAIRKKIGTLEIRNIIQLVGLDPYNRKHVGKYSMGMKQRLGIAQALMEQPSIVILDEPMSGLDNEGVRQMRALFKDLRSQGKTLVITSHNSEDIDELCDTVFHMDRGALNPREPSSHRV